MFAPRPFDVAKEMVRVTRPGGRIVMGNWIPGDPTLVAQILKISSAYSPPPPEGFVSPMTWGIDERRGRALRRGGRPRGADLLRPRHVRVRRARRRRRSSSALFRNYYGPTMNAFEAAEADGRAGDLLGELEGLFEAQNQATTAGETSIPATFLQVTAEV